MVGLSLVCNASRISLCKLGYALASSQGMIFSKWNLQSFEHLFLWTSGLARSTVSGEAAPHSWSLALVDSFLMFFCVALHSTRAQHALCPRGESRCCGSSNIDCPGEIHQSARKPSLALLFAGLKSAMKLLYVSVASRSFAKMRHTLQIQLRWDAHSFHPNFCFWAFWPFPIDRSMLRKWKLLLYGGLSMSDSSRFAEIGESARQSDKGDVSEGSVGVFQQRKPWLRGGKGVACDPTYLLVACVPQGMGWDLMDSL